MSEILYLKFEQNISTYQRTVTLGEAAELRCADSAVLNHLKTLKLFTFQQVRKGAHTCAARQAVSILEVVGKIQEVYPALEIQNLGEQDFIVEYSTKPEENRVVCLAKTAFVCLICFFGSAFSIMAFNNDVSTVDLFGQFYLLLTGEVSNGFTILELTYSLGLSVGILLFFNHVGRRKLTKDPTPIEVEMRTYEEEINKTLIQAASRSAGQPKKKP